MASVIIGSLQKRVRYEPTSALRDSPRLFQQALPGNRSILVRALRSLIEIRIEIQLTLDYTFNGSFLPFPNKVAVMEFDLILPSPNTSVPFCITDAAQLFNTMTVSV